MNDARGEGARSGHADLLAKNRPHSDFKAVPAPGQAQAGALRDQRAQQSIVREYPGDRLGIGIEIEHASQRGHHTKYLR